MKALLRLAFLGLAVAPITHAQLLDSGRVTENSYANVAGLSPRNFVETYSEYFHPMRSGWDANSVVATAGALQLLARNCRGNTCASARDVSVDVTANTVQVASNDGTGKRLGSSNASSDQRVTSLLDIGLLIIFAGSLLAYPLIRKQRTLDHSAVLTS